jgi:hypothetical protein
MHLLTIIVGHVKCFLRHDSVSDPMTHCYYDLEMSMYDAQ